jgi:hypothetical protein
MALHFSPVDTPLRDLQVWHAESSDYSFAISHEIRSGPGLRGKPGFIASWRPKHSNRSAVAVEGSPFAASEEAEKACELVLVHLSASSWCEHFLELFLWSQSWPRCLDGWLANLPKRLAAQRTKLVAPGPPILKRYEPLLITAWGSLDWEARAMILTAVACAVLLCALALAAEADWG